MPVVKCGEMTRENSKRWCPRDEKSPLGDSEQEGSREQHFNRIRLNVVVRTFCRTYKHKHRDKLGYNSWMIGYYPVKRHDGSLN